MIKIIILLLISIIGAKELTIGTGVGNNREEALKLAQRNAVERSMGTNLRSSTFLINGGSDSAIVQDSILSNAAGYIDSYSIITEDLLAESKWRVTIEAQVEEFRNPKKSKWFIVLLILAGIGYGVYDHYDGDFLDINVIMENNQ